MALTQRESTEPISLKPLRLWPGVVIVMLQWLFRFVVPLVAPDAAIVAVMGGLAGGFLLVVWWLFFSRAPWPERLGALALAVVAVLATKRFVHPSISTGMMGMILPIFAVPFLSLALVAGAVASGRLSRGLWRVTLFGAIVVASGVMTLVRTAGMTGAGLSDFHWRWTKTPEERLVAEASRRAPSRVEGAASSSIERPMASVANTAGGKTDARWSNFRGPQRDGIVRGIQIATDWSRSAPMELWRRPIGPGWSSFAVDGNLIYTQEQRGEDEVVSCYELTAGTPVWSHGDPARFWESNAGAGPRGTPTLANGRVYTLGATGILNALDARTGSVVWSRNAAVDTKEKVPGWGFAASPLVVGDTVIIATAGVLAAYNINLGQPLWIGSKGSGGYSSPHLATFDGVEQVVLVNGDGAKSVAPADGKPLWDHAWKSDGIVQPAVLAGGDILIGSGSGMAGKVGLRRVAIAHVPTGWNTEERWTSNRLKPYFNDFVLHHNHAFGIDNGTLVCVELEGGERKWKGGRYGSGQLILLADQELLLVLSEQGELALVRAIPEQFTELARFKALEGKTWNHPVLAGDILLVRNDREMVAFRLSLKGI